TGGGGYEGAGPQDDVVGLGLFRRPGAKSRQLQLVDPHGQRAGDRLHDALLDFGDVARFVLAGPEDHAAPGVAQIHRHAQLSRSLAEAALHDVARAQFLLHHAPAGRTLLELFHRVARNYPQFGEAAQRIDDVLRDTVGEVVALGIAAQIR